ncbi:hypothetical protein ACOSQ3_014334 [Xanthoceras sorbifolium]
MSNGNLENHPPYPKVLQQKTKTDDVPHQKNHSKSRGARELKQADLASSTCNQKSTTSLQQKQVDSGGISCSNRLTNSHRPDQLIAYFYSSIDRPKKTVSVSSNHGFNHDCMQQNLLFSLPQPKINQISPLLLSVKSFN